MIKVNIWEYERGWGNKIDSTVEFETIEEAKIYIVEFNSSNTETEVPDWYMTAKLDLASLRE